MFLMLLVEGLDREEDERDWSSPVDVVGEPRVGQLMPEVTCVVTISLFMNLERVWHERVDLFFLGFLFLLFCKLHDGGGQLIEDGVGLWA